MSLGDRLGKPKAGERGTGTIRKAQWQIGGLAMADWNAMVEIPQAAGTLIR
jgi:hypothetical protein